MSTPKIPVKRGKPLEPISLGQFDGLLLPEPWRRVEDELTEGSAMPEPGEPIGEHALCGGLIAWVRTAAGVRTIFCKTCGLRFSVAEATSTWAELRAQCRQHFPIPESAWPKEPM